ncbi:MAG: NAD(P)-binding domain-containing protein, partial [Oscillospiraceae bacterium]
MKKVGFIGCGNMGKAIALGLLKSTSVDVKNLMIAEKSEFSIKAIKEEIGIDCCTSIDVAKECD